MGKRQLKSKIKLKTSIKIDAYEVICRAIEMGLRFGWNRAHKHTNKPDEETMKTEMYNAITNELWEVIKLDEG